MSNRERLTALIERARRRETLLEQARSNLASLGERFAALKSATYWAELDSGSNVAVGATVRYFGRNYICKKAHTKALLRSPSNGEYWEEVPDNE